MSRRQFTAEEKTQNVLEGLTTSISIAELCRKHAICETQFYKWREEFVEAGRQRFEAAGSNDIVKAKEKEIAKLKELVGDLTLVNDALKKKSSGAEKVAIVQALPIPIIRSARLLGISRSHCYYKTHERKRAVDNTKSSVLLNMAMRYPSFGYRRLAAMARKSLGRAINPHGSIKK